MGREPLIALYRARVLAAHGISPTAGVGPKIGDWEEGGLGAVWKLMQDAWDSLRA